MNFSDSRDPINYDDDDKVEDEDDDHLRNNDDGQNHDNSQQQMERVDITDDAGRPRHHPQSFP